MIKTGIIKENETWTGHISVRGNVSIPAGVAIHVDPGCTIEFSHKSEHITRYHNNTMFDSCVGHETSQDKCGIYVQGSFVASGTENNQITIVGRGYFRGIVAQCKGNISLEYCHVSGAEIGVAGDFLSSLRVVKSTIKNNEVGLFCLGNIELGSNYFLENRIGIFCQAMKKDDVGTNIIEDNRIEGNAYKGICCKQVDNLFLKNNIILRNQIGINIEESDTGLLTGNRIEENNIGLDCVDSDSMNLEKNRFAGNTTTSLMFRSANNKKITIKQNYCFGGVKGIEFSGISEAFLDENTFCGQETALVCSGQTKTSINSSGFEEMSMEAVRVQDMSEISISDSIIKGVNMGMAAVNESRIEIIRTRIESNNKGVLGSDIADIAINNSEIVSMNDAALSFSMNSTLSVAESKLSGLVCIESSGTSNIKLYGNHMLCKSVGLSLCGQSSAWLTDNEISGDAKIESKAVIASENTSLRLKSNIIKIVGSGYVISGGCDAEIKEDLVESRYAGLEASDFANIRMVGSKLKAEMDFTVKIGVNTNCVLEQCEFNAPNGMNISENSVVKIDNCIVRFKELGLGCSGQSSVHMSTTEFAGDGGKGHGMDMAGACELNCDGLKIGSVNSGLTVRDESRAALTGTALKALYKCVTVSGSASLNVDQGMFASESGCAIAFEMNASGKISGVDIYGDGGIEVSESGVVGVAGGKIAAREYGIRVMGQGRAEVEGCAIDGDGCEIGIDCSGVSETFCKGLKVSGVIEGIRIKDEAKGDLCDVEIESGSKSMNISGMSRVKIKGGKLSSAEGCTVISEMSSNIEMEGVDIYGDGGIEVSESGSVGVAGGKITGREYGIRIMAQGNLECKDIRIEGECAIEVNGNGVIALKDSFIECKKFGVKANETAKLNIANSRIQCDEGCNGIDCGGVSDLEINGTEIENAGHGIWLREEAKGKISGNRIRGHDKTRSLGVRAEGVSLASVSKNTILNTQYGIFICDEADVKYLDNTIDALEEVKFDKVVSGAEYAQPKARVSRAVKIRHLLQRAVLSSRNIVPLRILYKAFYRLALMTAGILYGNMRGVKALYLRRGLNYSDWIPGLSDIDLQLVIDENGAAGELRLVKKVWRSYFILKALFPMLGEMHVATRREIENYIKWGDLRALEAPGTWSAIFGEKIRGAGFADEKKFESDVFGELLDSWRAMTDVFLNRANYPNADPLFAKHFIDITKNLFILRDKEVRIYAKRHDILARAEEEAADTGSREIIAQIISVWAEGEKISEEQLRAAYMHCFNSIRGAADSLVEARVKLAGQAKIGDYGKLPADHDIGAEFSLTRFKRWESICFEISRLMAGGMKGAVLEKPGLMYLILDNGAAAGPKTADSIKLSAALLKNDTGTENTPCMILTDNMYKIFINTLHQGTPFHYFALLGTEKKGALITANYEKWQFNLTSEDYDDAFPVDRGLLFRETIAIITLSFRIYDSFSCWAGKARISKYFEVILGLRLAVEKKRIAEPYLDNVLMNYKKEFPLENEEISYFREHVLDDRVAGVTWKDSERCYAFLKKALDRLNENLDEEALNGPKERELCRQ